MITCITLIICFRSLVLKLTLKMRNWEFRLASHATKERRWSVGRGSMSQDGRFLSLTFSFHLFSLSLVLSSPCVLLLIFPSGYSFGPKPSTLWDPWDDRQQLNTAGPIDATGRFFGFPSRGPCVWFLWQCCCEVCP